MSVVPVFLRKRYRNLNPGEIAGFPSEKAEQLIKSKIAFAVDENRRPIITDDEDELDLPEETQPPAANLESVQKFVIDGLTERVAELLVGAGLGTPEQIRQHVKAGKRLENIKGIGVKTAAEIEELYGEDDDFGDDESEGDLLSDEEDDDGSFEDDAP